MEKLKLTIDEYHNRCEEYNGYCTSCGAIRWGMTEPDAEGYPCTECGAMAVMGMENAMMEGLIDLEG